MPTWMNIETPRPFVKVEGENKFQATLAAAFGILAGRSDGNTLDRVLKADPTGLTCFARGTDSIRLPGALVNNFRLTL